MFKLKKFLCPSLKKAKDKDRVIPKGWFDAYLDYDRYDIVCHWQINKSCNYRCEYCYLDDYDEKEQVKIRYQDYAEAFNKTNLRWHIRIDGGEPFFYDNFVELCVALTERHCISLNTNLSHNKNILKFSKQIDPQKVVQFKCSFHLGEVKKYGHLNQFIDSCKMLLQKHFNVLVTIVFYPPYIQEIIEIFKTFNENKIPVVGRVFNGTYGGKAYPKAYRRMDLNLLKTCLDPVDVYFLENGSSFVNDLCLAGQRFLLFHSDGSLQRCGNVDEYMGNIFKGDFNLNKEARTCPSHCCGCAYVGYLLTAKNARASESHE